MEYERKYDWPDLVRFGLYIGPGWVIARQIVKIAQGNNYQMSSRIFLIFFYRTTTIHPPKIK